MSLPSLKQLQYLVALHEHQHFGRAADSCSVSQSTLSVALKELEEALRMRLVERTKRLVIFTPTGVAVAHRAKELLRRAHELSLLGSPPLAGTLRMSIIPTIAPFLLLRILVGLRLAYPDLELQIYEEMSHEGCAGLASGRRDCMLLALPYDCGTLECVAIFEDPILVAVRFDDPLAEAAIVNPLDLSHERLLFLREGHCLRDHALRACQSLDHRPKSAPGASIHTLIQLVSAGMGVTLLPKLAVDAGVMAGTDVVARPLAGTETHRTVSLAWRRNSLRTETFAALASTLAEICLAPSVATPKRAMTG